MKLKIKRKLKPIIIVGVLFGIFLGYNVFWRNEEGIVRWKYGSRRSEITQIQNKLKR